MSVSVKNRSPFNLLYEMSYYYPNLDHENCPTVSSDYYIKYFNTELDNFKTESDGKETVIVGTIPGYGKKDVKVEVKKEEYNNQITIKVGEDITRTYGLVRDDDLDNISAVCTNGILTITIPKIVKEPEIKIIKVL